MSFASKKFVVTLLTFAGPFIAITTGLFTGMVSAEQWMNFVSIQAPTIMGAYGVIDLAQKKIEK